MTQLIVTADVDSVDLARSEIEQVFTRQNGQELAPGVGLLTVAEPWPVVAAQWRTAPPIFVRHVMPVQAIIPLRGELTRDSADLQALVLEQFAPLIEPQQSFSVQTRLLADLPYKPYDLNTALAEALQQATGAALDVRSPAQVLSVVCARVVSQRKPPAEQPLHVYLGLSLASDNLSNWAGGMRRFAREEGQISRSEFKLLEALEVFHIDLPARGVALDLGAAPGGWTRVLRQHEQYVTAVDPGELDPRLAQDRGVRHRRMSAEAYLGSDPDPFDLIVNDMRMDARDSARLMVAYAPHLYPHGQVIMTLKLPEEQRQPILDHAFAILRERYQIMGARQLFHNRSEITVYLRPETDKVTR
jgi:23S rRNA (cytidine2498-2'-O)-methyltransferase